MDMERTMVVPFVDKTGKEISRMVMKVNETQDAFIFTTIRDYSMEHYKWNISKQDLMDAMTKRFPKKPVFTDETHCYCGSCSRRIRLKHRPRFCGSCVQKVDWDD